MATQLSDSNFEFRLVPITADEDAAMPVGENADDGMQSIDLSSNDPLPELPDKKLPVLGTATNLQQAGFGTAAFGVGASGDAANISRLEGGSLWLEGDVLMCGCPDCRAPMSIRLWLMIADCWNCGTSIELSEQQEREAERLLQRRAEAEKSVARQAVAKRESQPQPGRTQPKAPSPSSPPSPPPSPPQPAAGTQSPPTTQPGNSQPGNSTPRNDVKRTASANRASPTTTTRPPSLAPQPANRQRRTAAENLARRRLSRSRERVRGLINSTPAWFVSLVLHMVALTLLALLTLPDDDDGRAITLNATVSKDLRREGEAEIVQPNDEVQFDLPVPPEIDMNDRQSREAMIKADQDARELRITDTADPAMPDLARIKQKIGKPDGHSAAVAARDPRVRVELIKQEGGTTLTEAAVARGLRWLAQQQQADGRWRLDGGTSCDAAGTSLALFPFLGAGQTHLTGRYKDEVAKGLRWMVSQQRENGDLRAGHRGNAGMYAHGQATIVLCEAFMMTGDEELRIPAQKAVDFIVAAQYDDGGWRYKPKSEASRGEQRGDTSVVGWQLMALQSARAANLTVPDETFELVSHYLDSVQARDGIQYCYQVRNRPTEVMTAEALLCRMYLGWTKDNQSLMDSVQWLEENHMPSASSPNMYYWYYGTQTFHHVGGEHWDRWNLRMREILVNMQEKNGRFAGSWPAKGGHAASGGRIYMTSLATCTLEVYYRHLPIFRQIDLD